MNSYQGVEISAASMAKSNNIRITKTSPKPQQPVAPKRTQNILLAGLLALIGGVGLVLFLDYVNNKIESVEDIDRYMKLPALGVIPVLQGGGKARRLIGSKNSKELAPAVAGNNNQVILTQIEANSPVAESYRQLRTALLLSSAVMHRARYSSLAVSRRKEKPRPASTRQSRWRKLALPY